MIDLTHCRVRLGVRHALVSLRYLDCGESLAAFVYFDCVTSRTALESRDVPVPLLLSDTSLHHFSLPQHSIIKIYTPLHYVHIQPMFIYHEMIDNVLHIDI